MKYTFFFISVFLFISCSKTQTSYNVPKIKLNLSDTSTVFLEDIAQDVSVVNLENGGENTLVMPTNFFVTDSIILIGDRARGSVFIYDKKGNLINRIGHRGSNFGDFQDMTDVWFDADQKQINILDKTSTKIFVFGTDGRFLKTTDILNPENLGMVFAKNSKMYVTTAPRNDQNKAISRLSIYEKNGDMLSFHAPGLTSPPLITDLDIVFPHQLEVYKDSIYFLPLLDYNIYNIGFNSAKPAYQIEVPEENQITDEIKEKKVAKDHFDYWKTMDKYKLLYNLSSLFITDDWVSFRYDFMSMHHSRNVFYSKKTGKVLQVTEFRSKKDTTFRSRSMVLAKYGDYFLIGVPNAVKADEKFNKERKSGPLKMSFRLVFFKLKDF
ncbi:6-bladed beta-propeller [Mucilaginibacter corticis]|uniref:6-bladed beta-propeller n=1 Tax=Mucilaginibacter corticis TaxID=2597670 RepID=A0A556MTB6_9SPHI|nr:6-bladed beta-propeller [Mucilaginibacter corticis]TSJ43048.1 6-bladed beta-propeller [Mucilaginibacter corticis]